MSSPSLRQFVHSDPKAVTDTDVIQTRGPAAVILHSFASFACLMAPAITCGPSADQTSEPSNFRRQNCPLDCIQIGSFLHFCISSSRGHKTRLGTDPRSVVFVVFPFLGPLLAASIHLLWHWQNPLQMAPRTVAALHESEQTSYFKLNTESLAVSCRWMSAC